MVGSINNFGGYNERQIKQNPDEYAKIYAEQNGLSIEDAKAELKAQHGDPVQDASGSIFNFNSDSNMNNMNFSNIYDSPELQLNSNEQNGISSLLQQFMNFLNGNNNTDKNGLMNNEVEANRPNFQQNQIEGPSGMNGQHRIGVPQTNLGQNGGMNGPQRPGDPQPHFEQGAGMNNQHRVGIPQQNMWQNGGMNGPQQPGDPQPHLGQGGENPFQQQTPDMPSIPEIPQQQNAPEEPSAPVEPSEPVKPSEPVEPSAPVEPSVPEKPSEPVEPSEPEKPSKPPRPDGPQQPSAPEKPSEPQKPERPERPELS